MAYPNRQKREMLDHRMVESLSAYQLRHRLKASSFKFDVLSKVEHSRPSKNGNPIAVKIVLLDVFAKYYLRDTVRVVLLISAPNQLTTQYSSTYPRVSDALFPASYLYRE